MARRSIGEFYHLNGGMDDKSDPLEIPPHMFRDLTNFTVQRNSLHKRQGYSKNYDSAVNGGEEVQRIIQHEKVSDQTLLDVIVAGGNIYSGSSQTDVTGDINIVNNKDVKPSLASWDGQLVGTDGTNPPFLFTDPSSDTGVVLSTRNGAPSKAEIVIPYKEHMVFLNLTDPDTKVRPYGICWSNPFDPSRYGADAHQDINRNQAIKAAVVHNSWLLVFQERSTHLMLLEASANTPDMPFRFDQIDNNVGCPGKDLCVNTEKGTFFIGAPNKGIYYIEPGQPRPPRYIGKPLETFFSEVNWSRIQYGWAEEIPEKNLVVFGVPHGSNQQNNNKIVVLNYDQWSLDADQDPHPAYSIWQGSMSKPLSFNAATRAVDSNGRYRIHVGDYSGFVHTLDNTDADDGESIQALLETPYYPFGSRGNEALFSGMAIDVKLEAEKLVTVTYRAHRSKTTASSSHTGGTTGAVFGTATFGGSVFGGNVFGTIPAKLRGRGRFLDLRLRTQDNTSPFELHGVSFYGDHVGAWAA